MKFKNRSARASLEPCSDRADWKSVLAGDLAIVAMDAARDVSVRLESGQEFRYGLFGLSARPLILSREIELTVLRAEVRLGGDRRH